MSIKSSRLQSFKEEDLQKMQRGVRMLLRSAELSDMNEWKKVATDVAEIFGHLGMPNDPEFIEYAERKKKKKEAITAVDTETEECVGFIGFSRNVNRITWFGILEKSRSQGIGGRLLETALKELDYSKDITVETFREDYVLGKPARNIYFKHGFVEIDNSLFDYIGNERCKLAILPSVPSREKA
jgi:GNAT superfamily N-acetyltransferase